MRIVYICALIIFLTSSPPSQALMASENTSLFHDNFSYNADFRPVYYYVNTTNRDGTEQTDRSINLRARLRLSYQLSDNFTFRVRAATRLSSNQEEFRFVFEDHTGGSGTYPAGIGTLDELMLRWQISPGVRLTAGRFQGRFPLAGHIPKGVDRYYASNLSISHTDGLWLEWDATDSWRLHLIGSHNSTSGSTHAARAPLRFDESGAARLTAHRLLDTLRIPFPPA